jgi:hypothetical protein
MSSLEVLLLDNNILVGTIPHQLGQLSRLRRLNLAAQGARQQQQQQQRRRLVSTKHSSTATVSTPLLL